MNNDDLIVEAAKRILLDQEDPSVLATGFLRGVSYDLSVNNIHYGSATYQQPGKPSVTLDIVFDCTEEQLKRLMEKHNKHTFKVILVDGDYNA